MQFVSDLEPFKSSKLATKFKHIPTDRVYLLRRITNGNNESTLYLWCKDTEDQHFGIYPEQWEQVIPPKIDPQATLIRLLECIHDGDRIEILEAMDELHDHIRHMGTLPVIQRDTTYNQDHPVESVYLVPNKVDDIS